jgi:hypothetical protein
MAKAIVFGWSRLLTSLRNLSMVLLFAAAIAGVVVWIRPPPDQKPDAVSERERDGRPGDGIIVSSHVVHIWLPEPLDAWARQNLRSFSELSHDDLRKIIERQDHQSLFYAFTVRALQADGHWEDISFIRHPFREPDNRQEFVDILATAAGVPPLHRALDYSRAEVHFVPPTMTRNELLEAISASPKSYMNATRDGTSGRLSH